MSILRQFTLVEQVGPYAMGPHQFPSLYETSNGYYESRGNNGLIAIPIRVPSLFTANGVEYHVVVQRGYKPVAADANQMLPYELFDGGLHCSILRDGQKLMSYNAVPTSPAFTVRETFYLERENGFTGMPIRIAAQSAIEQAFLAATEYAQIVDLSWRGGGVEELSRQAGVGSLSDNENILAAAQADERFNNAY